LQETPTDPKPKIEAFALNATGGSTGADMERVCNDNELVISTWSPIHLRTKLKELYWKEDQPAANAAAFFEDTLRYLYMPRFRNRDVLAQAIKTGAVSRDFFGIAYGQGGGKFEGFQLGTGSVIFDDTLLLIAQEAAAAYEIASRPAESPVTTPGQAGPLPSDTPPSSSGPSKTTTPGVAPKPTAFHATAGVPVATAKMRLVQIAEEIVSVLNSDPNAAVRVVLEISADFPDGAKDTVKRAVSENAKSLGLKSADWE